MQYVNQLAKEPQMLTKKLAASIAVLMAAAAMSAPALADGYHGRGHGYGHYKHARTVVVQRPVVVHQYYRPAPRPVYVVHRPAPVYAPVAPVYYYARPEPVVPLLVGAVIGAAIVHHAVTSGY
jgi:hypothetical protein